MAKRRKRIPNDKKHPRTHEPVTDGKEEMRPILALIEQSTGLCPDDAYLFHLEMWLYVHGIAAALLFLRQMKK